MNQAIWKKYARQIGSFPQVGVKTKNKVKPPPRNTLLEKNTRRNPVLNLNSISWDLNTLVSPFSGVWLAVFFFGQTKTGGAWNGNMKLGKFRACDSANPCGGRDWQENYRNPIDLFANDKELMKPIVTNTPFTCSFASINLSPFLFYFNNWNYPSTSSQIALIMSLHLKPIIWHPHLNKDTFTSISPFFGELPRHCWMSTAKMRKFLSFTMMLSPH